MKDFLETLLQIAPKGTSRAIRERTFAKALKKRMIDLGMQGSIEYSDEEIQQKYVEEVFTPLEGDAAGLGKEFFLLGVIFKDCLPE